ncbi:MAG: hypothetical protein D4R93_02715, partial [Deltaproteobacteria bacterium]
MENDLLLVAHLLWIREDSPVTTVPEVGEESVEEPRYRADVLLRTAVKLRCLEYLFADGLPGPLVVEDL